MIKINGIVDETKKIQGTKFIIQTVPAVDHTVPLDGSDLIPIDLGGRLVTHTAIPLNELGKCLLKAAVDGDVDEVKALLTKGAPFTADWLGTSPLHLAAQNNHLEICEILLRAGISKDARTKVDRTPLHMAAYEGHVDIVETLIKHGADIDSKDLLGMTPLHWAVQNGHRHITEVLIRNGAVINLHSKFNLTPVHIAQQIARPDIEDLINSSLADSALATQNLVIQLQAGVGSQTFSDDADLENSNHESIIIPIEPHVMEHFEQESSEMEEVSSPAGNENAYHEPDQETIENENEELVQSVQVDASNFTDSLKLLQEHGITMLQNDENEESNILNTVMESGHSVVLTEVGKEVLKSVKQSEQQQLRTEEKVVSVTPEQLLALANGPRQLVRQLRVAPAKNQVRRIVMRKNKVVPVTSVTSIPDQQKDPTVSVAEKDLRTDMETIMNQLIEAKKTIEEYKIKLQRKEEEAERYKMQLKLFMDT